MEYYSLKGINYWYMQHEYISNKIYWAKKAMEPRSRALQADSLPFEPWMFKSCYQSTKKKKKVEDAREAQLIGEM